MEKTGKKKLMLHRAFEVLYGEALSIWMKDEDGRDYLGYMGKHGHVVMEVTYDALLSYREGIINMYDLYLTELVLESGPDGWIPAYEGKFEDDEETMYADEIELHWKQFNEDFMGGLLRFENPHPVDIDDDNGEYEYNGSDKEDDYMIALPLSEDLNLENVEEWYPEDDECASREFWLEWLGDKED